jgi:hypothetical protein
LTDDRPRPDGAEQQRDLDAEVEELTRRIADVVRTAGAEQRQDLREYAIGLLKEETEFAEAPPTAFPARPAAPFNPLALGLLLGLIALPLLLVFAPFGLVILLFSGVLIAWGLVSTFFRRR